MDETAKNATQILFRFVTDKERKLQYGLKQRAEMQAVLQRGESPTGYRVDWINKTCAAVFKVMVEKAAEFNVLHPQDRISLHDFGDVLATAMNKLKNSSSR